MQTFRFDISFGKFSFPIMERGNGYDTRHDDCKTLNFKDSGVFIAWLCLTPTVSCLVVAKITKLVIL